MDQTEVAVDSVKPLNFSKDDFHIPFLYCVLYISELQSWTKPQKYTKHFILNKFEFVEHFKASLQLSKETM